MGGKLSSVKDKLVCIQCLPRCKNIKVCRTGLESNFHYSVGL